MGLKDEYSNDGEGYGLDEYGIEPQDDSRETPNVVDAGNRGQQMPESLTINTPDEGAGKTQTTTEE